MSDLDDQIKDSSRFHLVQTKEPPFAPLYADRVFKRYHQHKISDSTAATGSSDSSPTTTISTVDDSSATEPSPGSSPESPPPSNFAMSMLRPRTSEDRNTSFFELQKQPPSKKGRNLKNLAVNTSGHPGRAASTTSLPLSGFGGRFEQSSCPSPSFVKPPSPPRRRPSNLGLTLLTPSSTKAQPQEIRLAIPSAPGFGRPGTLRHFQSSPSLPLFSSHATPQIKTTQLPRLHQTALEPILSPSVSQQPQLEEEEPNYDIPLSQEEKPEAYPNGPICVYDPHIDLYLEPSAEEARKYDVVVNVASEVRNPFQRDQAHLPSDTDIRVDGGGGIQFAPRRDHSGLQNSDYEAASSTRDSSPSTPKATPLNSPIAIDSSSSIRKDEPEYIHIPWEHNSDIVPDLLRLVRVMDEKVAQGKRVLVHCQCGVSRSASLIVAYGLYKNQNQTVREAYDAVKAKSKWIGPNMNLIMQLQEFQSSLARGGLLASNRGLTPLTPNLAAVDWRGPFSRNPTDPASSAAPLSAGVAPLTKAQTADSLPLIEPGPSSAPSALTFPVIDHTPSGRSRALSAFKPGSAYVSPSGHLVPVLPKIALSAVEAKREESSSRAKRLSKDTTQSESHETANSASKLLEEPKTAEFAMTPLQPSPEVHPEDSFGLMSPSSSEFAASPFDRSALLAQLGMGSVREEQDQSPRRSVSLQSRKSPSQEKPGEQKSPRKLRGKISSPGIREQQRLHALQTRIQAQLPSRHKAAEGGAFGNMDEALLSPRATEFTQNPFALPIRTSSVASNLDGAVAGTTATTATTPRTTDADPRSPAQKGSSPIIRNILDFL